MAFHALYEVTADYNMPVFFNTQAVLDDDESYSDFKPITQFDDALVEGVIDQNWSRYSPTNINFPNEPVLIEEKELEQEMTATTELLHIHQKLNHLPFKVHTAHGCNGDFAKRLVDCCVPQCSTLVYLEKEPLDHGQLMHNKQVTA